MPKSLFNMEFMLKSHAKERLAPFFLWFFSFYMSGIVPNIGTRYSLGSIFLNFLLGMRVGFFLPCSVPGILCLKS